jgi:hydroxymethylbilane synthase
MKNRILVGTRGSQLALAQANQIINELREAVPSVKCKVVPICTRGDEMHVVAVEGKSIFTREIEEALIHGRVDIAVHSMKDLPMDPSTGTTLAAIPKRANPHDVLISREKRKFSQLPPRARVGTSSPRRKSQLLAARGDLEVVDIRGNVDTRLRKLANSAYDAIVVAAAGLERLHLDSNATEILPTNLMLPAVGQGALAVQSRDGDEEIMELMIRIDHSITRKEIEAERAFAKRLGANCRTPIAGYARSDSSKLTIEGMVASRNGRILVRGRVSSNNPNSSQIGEELAKSLLDKGASVLLEGL